MIGANASAGRVTSFFRRPLTPGPVMRDRDAALCRLLLNRRVIHIGCVDWPITDERLRDGSLLHGKLLESSDVVLGVDVDEPGLVELERSLGGVYRALDLSASTAVDADLVAFSPDNILLADVIEHVPRPQALLEGIAAVATATGARVIITTPNALSFRNVINTSLGYEVIHPDHVCLHTAATLGALASRSGLNVDAWAYYDITTGPDPLHRSYDGLARLPARLRPAWADGLIAVCSAARE